LSAACCLRVGSRRYLNVRIIEAGLLPLAAILCVPMRKGPAAAFVGTAFDHVLDDRQRFLIVEGAITGMILPRQSFLPVPQLATHLGRRRRRPVVAAVGMGVYGQGLASRLPLVVGQEGRAASQALAAFAFICSSEGVAAITHLA
jgi:hypothetical protein